MDGNSGLSTCAIVFCNEPCSTSRTRSAVARCRGIRRMCPTWPAGICEQAPDACSQVGHAWLIASRKMKEDMAICPLPDSLYIAQSAGAPLFDS